MFCRVVFSFAFIGDYFSIFVQILHDRSIFFNLLQF